MIIHLGKQIRKFTGHNGRVNGLCYGPQENVIVTKLSLIILRLVAAMILLSKFGITDQIHILLLKP